MLAFSHKMTIANLKLTPMFSFFQWFLFLCARLHKFIRDLRLLRFQAMIANPTPSPTYGLASYFFPIFTSYV